MSWGSLQSIVSEARALDEQNRNRPLVDCPRCGTPLDIRGDGMRHCPLGHFTTWASTMGELSSR